MSIRIQANKKKQIPMNYPLPSEYKPYFHRYISLVKGEDFFEQYDKTNLEFIQFLESIPLEKHDYFYAPGKWTIKQILRHLIDCDRVFGYRALVAARGDKSLLYSFDEDSYAQVSAHETCSLNYLIEEFKAVRFSNRCLFEQVTEEQSTSLANTEGHPMSVRAIAYILIGHVLHHTSVIKERYLKV